MFHSHCERTIRHQRETIEDLRLQMEALYARLDKEREANEERERELYSRVLAVTQPHVYQQTRDRVPALPVGIPGGLRQRRPVADPRHPLLRPELVETPTPAPAPAPTPASAPVPASNGKVVLPTTIVGPGQPIPQMVDPSTLGSE